MTFDKWALYDRVDELGGFAPRGGLLIVQASLRVLARSLPSDYADELATALPEGLAEFVEDVPAPSQFDEREFWRQIAARCGETDPATVQRGFWATIDALRERVGDEKVERWVSALPVSRETEAR